MHGQLTVLHSVFQPHIWQCSYRVFVKSAFKYETDAYKIL